MTARGSITVQLTPEQRQRLEKQAQRRGVPAAKLALEFVLAGLLDMEENADKRQRQGFAALARLRELTADLPPVDAVEIARQTREELEQRADRSLSS